MIIKHASLFFIKSHQEIYMFKCAMAFLLLSFNKPNLHILAVFIHYYLKDNISLHV